jgi:hypothetical protein
MILKPNVSSLNHNGRDLLKKTAADSYSKFASKGVADSYSKFASKLSTFPYQIWVNWLVDNNLTVSTDAQIVKRENKCSLQIVRVFILNKYLSLFV